MSNLTAKQQAFVREYLVDLNGAQAAIRAGYSKKSARQIAKENLTKPDIATAIAEAKASRAERTQVDQDYVLEIITETIDRCRQAKPVTDKSGNPVMVELPTGEVAPAYAFDAAAILKGADLLGKHVGLFEKDNEQKGKSLADALRAAGVAQ
ncbi:MAG TPA: terminase small subunit [Nitrospiraceae bacterium]|nr:terminase small subunit [Nitrospiraceae bacterium]